MTDQNDIIKVLEAHSTASEAADALLAPDGLITQIKNEAALDAVDSYSKVMATVWKAELTKKVSEEMDRYDAAISDKLDTVIPLLIQTTREAVAREMEEAALIMVSASDDKGFAIVAAILEKAAVIARVGLPKKSADK